MSFKSKLYTVLLCMCMCFAVVAIGVFALNIVNLKIGGTLSFKATGVEANIRNAKLYKEGEEDITTPAGTFNCFLVTGSSLRETKGGDVKCEHEFWFAKGIGLILWKNYDGYTGLVNVELISLSM